MDQSKNNSSPVSWREKLNEIIFEAETFRGKAFDVVLLIAILGSTLTVVLESVPELRNQFRPLFFYLEWGFTILFTIEYIMRLMCLRHPAGYMSSFFGVIDLLAVLPTYIGLLIPGAQSFLILRLLRLLRVFRILKLGAYLSAASLLRNAILASKRKVLVFLFAVLIMVLILGSMAYAIEGERHGFVSIPTSVYWAIVTITTVGYGDLAPQTTLGKLLASVAMLLGYAIIAVPTGIVTAEMARGSSSVSTRACSFCDRGGHDPDADYCKFCGGKL
ncbi:MAG: ion transporter [Chitinispirillaceae bacterium]